MDRLKIAKELLKVAKELIADKDYEYIYDPEHRKHPGGGYQKTQKGWQKGKKQKSGNGTAPVEMTRAQEELDRLADDEDNILYVSKNPNAHPSTLDKLADSEYIDVQQNVARNPSTDSKTLDRLTDIAFDPRNDVYGMLHDIASHRNTSTKTLDKIVKQDESIVQLNSQYHSQVTLMQEVADNPNTSTETLKKLSKYDMGPDDQKAKKVREKALNNLKNRTFDITKLSPKLREKVKDWDAEDIAKFLAWLKEHKG